MLSLLAGGLPTGWLLWEVLRAIDPVVVRALAAAAVGWTLVSLLAWRFLPWLAAHCAEPITIASEAVAKLHASKRSTPTMGGVLVNLAIVASIGLFADWQQTFAPMAVFLILALGLVGGCDDLIKLVTRTHGLKAGKKFAAQFAIAGLVGMLLYRDQASLPTQGEIVVPWFDARIALCVWYVPWAALVITWMSNAVNLTDGLDGLAGGCVVLTAAALAILALFSTQSISGEAAIVAAATCGAVLGFLRFNRHPARVFMGDTGALSLGGLLALVALELRQELLLCALGGVFVVETVSVIVQVAVYRWRRRRVFLCAPVHHHFQLQGWPEPLIVWRFWIAGAACSLLGLATIFGLPGEDQMTAQDEQSPSVAQPTDAESLASVMVIVP